MSENDRDNRGHFQTEHSDREYLAAVANREPAGTSEIAEEVGVTRQNADQRLRRLEDQGKLVARKSGRRSSGASEKHTLSSMLIRMIPSGKQKPTLVKR